MQVTCLLNHIELIFITYGLNLEQIQHIKVDLLILQKPLAYNAQMVFILNRPLLFVCHFEQSRVGTIERHRMDLLEGLADVTTDT